MSSGVQCTDECVTKFNELKLKHTCRFLIYKINDKNTEIGLETTGEKDATYAQFLTLLPENDCRYCVYDFEYTTSDGNPRNKIVFIYWSPDSAKVKSKMVYAASKDELKKKLVGVATEVQATERSEADHSAVLERVTAI